MYIYHGYMTFVIFIIYAITIMSLLSEQPESVKGAALKIVELIVWIVVFHLLGLVYYNILGDWYLNQSREVAFAVCYAVLRSKYPVEQKIVMCCSGYTLYVLLIGVIGASFISSQILIVICLSVGLFGITLFLRKYIITEFWIKPSWYIAVVLALALSGVTASANWKHEPGFSGYLMVSNLSLFITIMVLYRMLYIVNDFYEEQLELNARRQKQKADEDYVVLMNRNREELHILRHELKNRNAYISSMDENQEYTKLKDYLQKDSDNLIKINHFISSNNVIVDSVLNQKTMLAQISNIHLNYQLAIPTDISVEEMDLRSLLSNIMDNAIEACKKYGDGSLEIDFSMRQEKGYIFIHVENPTRQKPEAYNKVSLLTTKSDMQNHGYGTKIIKRIVDKYNGYVEYQVKNGIFITDVMLAVEEA